MKSNGKVALITGAAGGIGRALAHELSAKGYDIFAIDRSKNDLESLGAELNTQFPTGRYFSAELDLSQQNAAQEVYALTKSQNIQIDLLVNNVGFGKMGEHVLQSPDVMQTMLALNNLLMTNLCLYFGQDMKARGYGQILNVASLVGFSTSPYFSAYSGTKAYVIAFSVGIAREMKPYGVHVSCLCPGTTETNFLDTAAIDHKSSAGMRRFSSAFIATPQTVAKEGVKGLAKKKLVIVPTVFLKLQSFFLRIIPIETISGFVFKKITEANGEAGA